MSDTIKEKTVCFTGHRVIDTRDRAALLSSLYSTVMRLIADGFDTFICGGAFGFDTEAAECVLQARERFEGVRLFLFLPCRDQTAKWRSMADVARYKRIVGAADGVSYVSNFYTNACMLERNRRMVDASSVCVAYMRTSARAGGTAYTVRYAEKAGLRLINLAP